MSQQPSSMAHPPSQPRLMLTVNQVAEALGISRLKVYDLLNAGELKSKHIGRLRRVPADAVQSYIDSLPDA